MKVRNSYRRSARDRMHERGTRAARRHSYLAIRIFTERLKKDSFFNGKSIEVEITPTRMLEVMAAAKRIKRFERHMRRRSYRRRIDRVLLKARTTGGRIVHDWRSTRVVPR